MRLTVVGCSGSYPGPDSPASCYLVESAHEGRTWRILLDLGSGALGALHRYVDPLGVDAVFLSHLHPDHCSDMTGYYVMRKYHPTGLQPRIPVYGPQGTARRMAEAYGLPERPGMGEQFDFHEYAQGQDHSRDLLPVHLGPFTVEAALVVHPVDAFALRVSDGARSLCYSGDTAPAESLVRLAEETDLLLAEASFREGAPNPRGIHMTGKEAGEAAARARVGRLVLTHVPPWYDPLHALGEAKQVYDGPLELARGGATYDL